MGVLISKLPSEETAETREESHRGDRRGLSLEKGQQPRVLPRQEGGEVRKWGRCAGEAGVLLRGFGPPSI